MVGLDFSECGRGEEDAPIPQRFKGTSAFESVQPVRGSLTPLKSLRCSLSSPIRLLLAVVNNPSRQMASCATSQCHRAEISPARSGSRPLCRGNVRKAAG